MQHKKDWLIIANGEPLAREELLKLAEGRAVMVLDGAYTSSLTEYLRPQVVLGDLDSLDETLKKSLAEDKALSLVQEMDQNTTDLEKGLLYLVKQKASSVTITNATGWRLDHTLYNLELLKRFHKSFKSLMLVTAREKIFYIKNQKVRLEDEIPQPLALLGFTAAEVTSSGLLYELKQLPLQLGIRQSISNAIKTPSAELEVEGELLLLLSHSTQVTII